MDLKVDKLIFFKNITDNIEIIYNYMRIYSQKGIHIPLTIKIDIKYPEDIYHINELVKPFDEITNILIEALNYYEEKLILFYQQNEYLRFLHGKLFEKLANHLKNNTNIEDLLRYILNENNSDKNIIDGDIIKNKIHENENKNFIEQYKNKIKDSFINISNFINSLFSKNGSSLQKHFEKMLIKEKNIIIKDIYLRVCENESSEEFILDLFIEEIGLFPIAQNVLFCGKGTSFEEIQSFFARAILNSHNTLYAV